MAYFIEFSQDRDEGFYVEIVFINKNANNAVVLGMGIDHQLLIYGDRYGNDYGFYGRYARLVASNSNGLITVPAPGVIAINAPPSQFFGPNDPDTNGFYWNQYEHRCNRVFRFKLLAVPPNTDFTKTIATGTISFGDRIMPSPRIQLSVYPLYPNSETAVPIVPSVQVAQVKQQLIKIGALDTVEAALLGPTDPATISWTVGGPINLGGPLSNRIASALSYDAITMGLFLSAANANPL